MAISSLGYNIKQGIKNIWRNRMFTLASLITMTTCVFLFGTLLSVVLNVNTAAKYYEQEVGITVLFDEGISEERIQEIGQEIQKCEGVASIDFISADEAWKEFQETYFEGDPEAAASFGTDNPLVNSASYSVKTTSIEEQTAVEKYITGIDGVRTVNRSDDVVKALTKFNTILTVVSVGITAILLIVAVILISMTVNVGISVRKNEISIMKLIGATDGFVRAPFLVEGVLIGLIGAIIPLVILYFTYNGLVGSIIEKYLSSLSSVFMTVNEIFAYLIPISLILGVGIGLLGSIITVRRHLNV
ncbi:MAG: permease-like cell division protein FtsX [Lachnospiraceae bacterium]|nr:permease-like cell division protein FtsX [Lachnospiraceae bacterium]